MYKCTTCAHKRVADGVQRCALLRTHCEGKAPADLGESLPACRYEKKPAKKKTETPPDDDRTESGLITDEM